METTVLIQSAPKPDAAFPPSQWCYTYNLIKIGQLTSEIFKFESVDDDGRRRTTDDDGRTDDGPLVYYKLTLWAFGSGELKKRWLAPVWRAVNVLFLLFKSNIFDAWIIYKMTNWHQISGRLISYRLLHTNMRYFLSILMLHTKM